MNPLLLILAPLLLGGVLSPGAYYQDPNTSRWSCTATCLTTGRRDGGQCYAQTLVVGDQPTRQACHDKMKAACDKVPPPAGGCVQR